MASRRRLWRVRQGSGSASSTGAPAAAGSGAAPVLKRSDENEDWDGDVSEGLSVTFSQAGDSMISSADPDDDEDGTAVADPEGSCPSNCNGIGAAVLGTVIVMDGDCGIDTITAAANV